MINFKFLKFIALFVALASFQQAAADSGVSCSPLSGGCHAVSDLDVVSFSTKYSKEYASQLKQAGYRGLSNDLDQLVQDQNYAEVLKHVWTEDDLDLAIRRLRTYAQQGHAILMLELSRTLCRKMVADHQFPPKVIFEASTWHLNGLATTELDIACNTDQSTKSAVCTLFETYTLGKQIPQHELTKVHLPDIVDSFLTDWQMLDSYPSPKWVAYYGLKAYAENSLTPASEWKERRAARFQQIKTQR